MNRFRTFFALFAVVALLLLTVGTALADKNGAMQRKAFLATGQERLNSLAAAVNTADAAELAEDFTPEGLLMFQGSYELGRVSDIQVGEITHVLPSSDGVSSVAITANFIGLTGVHVFNTWEFTLVRQNDGDYLIDAFKPVYDWPTTNISDITSLSIDVRAGGQTRFSTEIDSAEYYYVKLWNADEAAHDVAVYPAGVSIIDPTQMAGRVNLEAQAGGELWLTGLISGRYIVVTDGIAAGTLLVGNRPADEMANKKVK